MVDAKAVTRDANERAADAIYAVSRCRSLDLTQLWRVFCALSASGMEPGDVTFEIADAIAATQPGSPGIRDSNTLPSPWGPVWETLYARYAHDD